MSVSSSYLLETSDCVPVFFGWHIDEWTNRLQKPLLNVAGIIGNLSICVLSVALGHLTMEWICFALIFPSMHFFHSEVLYLGHRETERTDADQICQILSNNLDNRSLGYCTV